MSVEGRYYCSTEMVNFLSGKKNCTVVEELTAEVNSKKFETEFTYKIYFDKF